MVLTTEVPFPSLCIDGSVMNYLFVDLFFHGMLTPAPAASSAVQPVGKAKFFYIERTNTFIMRYRMRHMDLYPLPLVKI